MFSRLVLGKAWRWQGAARLRPCAQRQRQGCAVAKSFAPCEVQELLLGAAPASTCVGGGPGHRPVFMASASSTLCVLLVLGPRQGSACNVAWRAFLLARISPRYRGAHVSCAAAGLVLSGAARLL